MILDKIMFFFFCVFTPPLQIPATAVYGPPPVHVHHEYGAPPSAYGAPTGPAHYAHSAPSAPTGYAAHKYPAHLDGNVNLFLISKKEFSSLSRGKLLYLKIIMLQVR